MFNLIWFLYGSIMCRALLLLFDTYRIVGILIEPDEKLISA